MADYITATSGEQLDEVIENTGRAEFGRSTGCALHSSLAFDLSGASLLAPLLLGELVCLPDGEQRADHLPSLLDERESYLWIKLMHSHARVAPGQVSSKAALGCARKIILGGETLSSHDLLE